MAPRLTWRDLIPGITAIVVLIGITIAVLARGGVGRVPGDKISLHVVTTSARGVMKGTPVWVSGQQIGTVESISFRPTTDSSRIVIGVRVQERPAQQIRRDSEIRVQSGTSVIGPMVVYITAGTPAAPPVRDGDTLYAQSQADLAGTVTRLNQATAQFQPIMADLRVIMALTRDSRGSVGALLAEDDKGNIAQLRTQVTRLRTQLLPENDGAARTAFMGTARDVMAQVDSIRVLLASGNTTLGRFRRDSTLGRTVARVRDELSTLRARLDSSDGSLGRFRNDSSITRALADAQREMGLLVEDIRKRPVRYIAF